MQYIRSDILTRSQHVLVASGSHGGGWKRKQGSYVNTSIAGASERIEWVAERAKHRGGAWALGCSVCAYALQKLKVESSAHARGYRGRMGSKWARFEVRSSHLQACALSQHASWYCHRVAMELYLSPETPVREVLLDARNLEDQELLKGSVPQLVLWLRAWKYLKEGISFRSSARLLTTEGFADGCDKNMDGRVVKALQEIIVEEKREQKRSWVRAASSCAVCVDDRGAWKILRFRCDHCKSFKTGVLGVLYRGGDGVSEVETWDRDFSEREAESIMNAIRAFCTSLVSGFDEGLLAHIRSISHVYASDGCAAALKTGRLLKTSHLPNIAFLCRDPAHAIRIAAKDPLHAEEIYGAFWTEVFDSQHALIRDVQCSDQLRAKLESCQQRVREVLGSQGAGLQSILKHMSAAKQRFESFASPARRYCLLLNALALLLALIASDVRKDKPTRDRAAAFLEAMTPESIVVAGLTADYTAECLDFVRRFDRSNVDPATMARARDDFNERMTALFLNGYAALQPPEGETQDRTMLQIAMQQVADMLVFYYNDKRHVLWSAGAAAKVKTSMARMAGVVKDLLQRVNVELSDSDMVSSFQVFNLAEWSNTDFSEGRTTVLLGHLRAITRSIGKDPVSVKAEFQRLLPVALANRQAKIASAPEGTIVDNRDVWGELLESDLIASCQVMPHVIRLYLAVPLGTPDVERNLGKLTALLAEHSGPNSGQTIWMLVEGALDLPDREEDLFGRTSSSAKVLLHLTDLSRSWQRKWLQLHGRRFASYSKTRSRAPAKQAKAVSESIIQKRRRCAASAMVQRARTSWQDDLDAKCFGGLARRELSGSSLMRVVKDMPQSKKQLQFRERTRLIANRRKAEGVLRSMGSGGKWCHQPKLRPNAKSMAAPPALPDRVQVVPMLSSASFHIAPSASVSVRPSLYCAVRVAHVVVVPDMSVIDKCDTWDAAILLIYAVGLWKIMISENDWQGDRPWAGPKAIRYQPQAMSSSIVIVASSNVQRHGNVMTALRACTGGSKWSVVLEKPANIGTAQVYHLNELPDVRIFLLQQRRIFQNRDVKGTFQRT